MSKPGPKPDPNAKRRSLTVKVSEAELRAITRSARKHDKPVRQYVRDAALAK